MSSTTDSIYASLSASSRSLPPVDLSNLEGAARARSKGKSKKGKGKRANDVKRELNLDAISIQLPTDTSSPSPTPSPSSPPPRGEGEGAGGVLAKEEETSLVEDIMDMCRVGSEGDGLDVVLAAGGDSDDDDDDDDATTPPPATTTAQQKNASERRWTIDRFNSALNSETKQVRVEALMALRTVLLNLSAPLNALRDLDLPPPYDPSRIVLTHKQGSMVSDMAKGEHAPHWAAWQKTQSGLMSQFLEDKTNQPLQPPEREDVDEGGDGLAPLRSAAGAATENTLRRQLQFLLDGTAQSLFKRFAGERIRNVLPTYPQLPPANPPSFLRPCREVPLPLHNLHHNHDPLRPRRLQAHPLPPPLSSLLPLQVLRVLWPMAEELGSSYESLSVADKKLFGAFCNAAVYHLIEGEVSEKEEQEGAKAKEKPKRKTKIKLQRVEIEFTDSDSDGDGDDDEIDEATLKLAEEAAKLMAAGRTEVAAGLKRVEILDEDEEEDDDDEIVDDVGKVNVDGRVGVTLSEYFDTLMPIGGTDWLKQGVDKLDDEAEFEAAAVYDGAMR